MIRSMTGYGKGESTDGNISVSVELKSVNHRFFELNAKIPRGYLYVDDMLKSVVSEKVARGKVDAFVNISLGDSEKIDISVRHSFVKAYIDALNEIADTYGVKNDITLSDIAEQSDSFVINEETPNAEVIKQLVKESASAALDTFLKMRETEGEKLYSDVKSRLGSMKEMVAFVEQKSPETVAAYRERLKQKMTELLDTATYDEQRLITETAIFADKIAVDEETVRLKSHISQFEKMLESDQPIGRKLDFIVQEMNRETNTIGSKSQNTDIAYTVVNLKSEIEKIREQIQNIE